MSYFAMFKSDLFKLRKHSFGLNILCILLLRHLPLLKGGHFLTLIVVILMHDLILLLISVYTEMITELFFVFQFYINRIK